MGLLKKRNCLISIVNNEDLSFIDPDTPDAGSVIHSLPLSQFLTDDAGIHIIPEGMKHRLNSLLIVPDYWFGNVIFKFQSRKKSIIEVFIERKLLAEYPDLPNIKYFFGYVPYHTEQKEKELYVFFLQEPTAFQLYNQLVKLNISPRCITTSSFIWGQKLKESVPNFQKGGQCLIHLFTKECFLYFYFQGLFLFSRSIAFPNPEIASSEKLNTLTYEINQSLYLFSQKAKAGIDHVYMTPSAQDSVKELSDMLGREVKALGAAGDPPPDDAFIFKHFGPAERFSWSDLWPSGKFLSILHQVQRKELEWKLVQTVGIAVGLMLLLLFIAESLFLWKWSQPSLIPTAKAGVRTLTEPTYTIQQYNEALDFVISESSRPSPQDIIIKVAQSLPDNFLIKEMTIALDEMPEVHIKGIVTATGPDTLKASIAYLLGNLKEYFQGARSMDMKDIDVEKNKTDKNRQGIQTYLVKLRYGLP